MSCGHALMRTLRTAGRSLRRTLWRPVRTQTRMRGRHAAQPKTRSPRSWKRPERRRTASWKPRGRRPKPAKTTRDRRRKASETTQTAKQWPDRTQTARQWPDGRRPRPSTNRHVPSPRPRQSTSRPLWLRVEKRLPWSSLRRSRPPSNSWRPSGCALSGLAATPSEHNRRLRRRLRSSWGRRRRALRRWWLRPRPRLSASGTTPKASSLPRRNVVTASMPRSATFATTSLRLVLPRSARCSWKNRTRTRPPLRSSKRPWTQSRQPSSQLTEVARSAPGFELSVGEWCWLSSVLSRLGARRTSGYVDIGMTGLTDVLAMPMWRLSLRPTARRWNRGRLQVDDAERRLGYCARHGHWTQTSAPYVQPTEIVQRRKGKGFCAVFPIAASHHDDPGPCVHVMRCAWKGSG